MFSRWHSLPLGVRLVALVAGLVCGAMGLELWAASQRPQLPGWGGPSGADGLMTSHPTRLWGMAPGVKPNAEDSQADINELGFRGPMPERPKPEGRVRIISLGDSSFYGFGVNDPETFDVQLTRMLRERDVDADSVNAGVAGYSIAQHAVALDEIIWDLDPDLLVLCNIWSDNTWDTFHDEDLLVSAEFARKNPLTRSAFVKLVAAQISAVSPTNEGKIIVWNGADGWPEGKVRRVPLDRWIELHHGVLVEASKRGVGAVFLKPTNSFLLSEAHDGPPPAWSPYFDAMDALAKLHGIPVVDVTSAYTEAMVDGIEATDLLWDKMHPTALGHAVLAAAIESTLTSIGWPEKRSIPAGVALPELGIEDVPNPQWTDDAGAGSPQVSLFELSPDEKQAMQNARKAMEARGPPRLDAIGTPQGAPSGEPGSLRAEGIGIGDVPPQTAAPPVGTWTTSIAVAGGVPPYTVRLTDSAGRTVGSARVPEPKAFSLKVRQDIDAVVVEAVDTELNAVRQQATPSAPSVSLTLGN